VTLALGAKLQVLMVSGPLATGRTVQN